MEEQKPNTTQEMLDIESQDEQKSWDTAEELPSTDILEEEEEDIDPLDIRIFGLPRLQFWGVTGGIGIGYILHGLLSMVIPFAFSVWWPAGICAVLGYFIGGMVDKKRKTQA